jgi:hypothetical protein
VEHEQTKTIPVGPGSVEKNQPSSTSERRSRVDTRWRELALAVPVEWPGLFELGVPDLGGSE